MMNSEDIRKAFLDFFASKGHEIIPSAPIVVKDDPTLMFTNAGMNQFKDYFLGNKKPSYHRVADTQKCLRVSGKHNDLEEVGADTYHHTMFEMLGNWSFGDPSFPGTGYFKKEAIAWSWELLTGIYKIPADRLYVTVFEGDNKEHLPVDEEAMAEWKQHVPADRILPFGKKDNFWEMGDSGPCGPCTEIHFDCRSAEERKKKDGKELVNHDHPEVIEIWNNVFIQYNRLKDGSLEPLPARHVDTGMGLERLVRVMQEKSSNYDTDIFARTLSDIEKITGLTYDGGDTRKAVAFRVIADHIRGIAFTIADGQLPSNTGAGYVIRRILRRAVRYYYTYLDYKQPLLNQLIPGLALKFKYPFSELYQQAEFVAKVVKEEEESFMRTLGTGLARLSKYFDSFGQEPFSIIEVNGSIDSMIKRVSEIVFFKDPNDLSKPSIPGSIVFELSDTYGFPPDLTKLIANERNWDIDEVGFDAEMRKQKDRSRAATSIESEDWVILKEGATNFVGYDSLEAAATILRYRKVRSKDRSGYQIVLNVTPFYPEGGGQVGDTGMLIEPSVAEDLGGRLKVTDTKKENDLIIHFTEALPRDTGAHLIARVDPLRRRNIQMHHSATHLVHAALRKVLGAHVTQKGSLVNDEHLRFDFSHIAKMTPDEIASVESLVNDRIREDIPVVIKQMPREQALKMGAMALFGEKYGDTVRVVIIDTAYSVELCGGTHVGSTGELGIFKIKSESAVAAGVRRIEAVTGKQAEIYLNTQLNTLQNIRELLKHPKDVERSIEGLLDENADLKKRIEHLEARQMVVIRNELLHKDQIINGVTFVGEIVEVTNADALKKLCFELKNKLNDHLAVLCANIDGKAHVAIGISERVVTAKKLDAGKIIKETVAPLINGGGGGQKTLATAGGQEVGRLSEVIEKVKALL